MEIYIEKQLLNIVYSLFLGLIFGFIYDIIRIMHILFGISSYTGENEGMKRGLVPFFVFFILDAVYMVFVTLTYSVFLYGANSGSNRAYIFISVCIGFALYYFTLGRVVMFFSEAVVRFLRTVFYYIVVLPLRFIGGLVLRLVRFLTNVTIIRLLSALHRAYLVWRTDKICRNIGRYISFEFFDGGGTG